MNKHNLSDNMSIYLIQSNQIKPDEILSNLFYLSVSLSLSLYIYIYIYT